MKTVSMHLDSQWFELIRTRKKVMEFRVYDDKRRDVAVGDTITFKSRADGQTMAVRVIKIITAPDWPSLADQLAPDEWGFDTKDDFLRRCAANPGYPAPEEAHFGVTAFGIEVMA